MTQAAPVTKARPASPGGAAPKRVVPAIATLLVRSETAAGKEKPLLTGLVVLFRTTTMSPIPAKAKSKTAGKDEPEAPVAEPRLFTAGIVDRRGYVVPWEQGRLERGQRKPVTTDSIKFVGPPSEDATYDFFLVSHPDPQRIQDILDNVNANGGVFTDADGAETKPLPMKLGKNKGKGNEHVLEVPEDPTKLLPPGGADAYGGWLLYRDMPFQRCAGVAKQIEKLQKALGAMRYPIGSGDDPYFPDDSKTGGNQGLFDVRTWNGVVALQRAVLAEGAAAAPLVKTDRVTALFGSGSKKDFASVAFAEKVTGSVPPGDLPKPRAADGVVDRATAMTIEHCVERGLRKPGFVLQPFRNTADASSFLWMRAEAAAAVAAWRKLAETFGWAGGIYTWHTYRTCLADVTSAAYGRATLSIHKSGYAIDLQMSGFIDPWSPDVFYEKVLRNGRVRWRLWAKIPVDKAKLGAGFDEVAKLLAQRHDRTRERIAASAKKTPLPEALGAGTIAGRYRACLDEAILGGQGFREAAAGVSKLLGLERGDAYDQILEEDVERLLDDEVLAFQYKRDHPSFACDAPSFFVTKKAGKDHVFLCLSALARLVRLTGISSFSDGWHSTRKSGSLPAAVTLPPGSKEPFASISSWLDTAQTRFDADLVASRSSALIDEVVREVFAVPQSKLGTREKKGAPFVAEKNLAPLVANVPGSIFERHLKPLVGSDLDDSSSAAAVALRAELGKLLGSFAELAIRQRATALERHPVPPPGDIKKEIAELGLPHRVAIDEAIRDFETKQPLDSGKLWRVKITRGPLVTEIPLRDVTRATVAAMTAWRKGWGDTLVTSPSVVLTDVKAKVNPADHAVSVDASQPRMKTLARIQGEIGDTTLEIKAVYFASGANTSAKTRTPVAGNVVAKVDVAKGGDVVDAVRQVLEKAYGDPVAVKFAPAIVVTPHFPVVDIREGDLVDVTYPGEPIGMEWWHHQYHPALQGEEEDGEAGEGGASQPKLWSTLLTEIGWELDILGDQPIAGAYGYPGVGYAAKDLAKVAR